MLGVWGILNWSGLGCDKLDTVVFTARASMEKWNADVATGGVIGMDDNGRDG